jgi:hypothetical protein
LRSNVSGGHPPQQVAQSGDGQRRSNDDAQDGLEALDIVVGDFDHDSAHFPRSEGDPN